jgi:hypothetical protein
MRTMSTVTMSTVLLATFGVVACGGSDSGAAVDTTVDTAVDTADDTADLAVDVTAGDASTPGSADAPAGSDAPGGSLPAVPLDDMPEQCRARYVDYIARMEPIVGGLDVGSMTQTEFDELTAELDAELPIDEFDAELADVGCDGFDIALSTTEARSQLLDIAADVAPTTVDFWSTLFAVYEGIGADGEPLASGDCDADIAALEQIAAAGTPMDELTIDELARPTALLASIGDVCPPDVGGSIYADEDIVAFLGE